jgi:hypothetical protein
MPRCPAAAGGVDLATAAGIAANALNTFNLTGEDMGHVADLIAGAANASAIDVNDSASRWLPLVVTDGQGYLDDLSSRHRDG